jgi:hypothetical protein
VDRKPADESSSDVVLADLPAAPDAGRSGRSPDALYRRPPARLPEPTQAPAEGTTGSSWFAGASPPASPYSAPAQTPSAATQTPASPAQTPAEATGEPLADPAPQAGPGRISFGFDAGPISPSRSADRPSTFPPPADRPAKFPSATERSPNFPSASQHSSSLPPAADRPVPFPPADHSAHFPSAGNRSAAAAMSPGRPPAWPADLDLPVRSVPADEPPEAEPATSPELSALAESPASPSWPPPARLAAAPVTHEPPTPQRPEGRTTEEPEPPRRSRFATIAVVLLSAVVLLVGTVIGIVYFSGSDQSLDSVLQLGAGNTKDRTVSAPLDNRGKASLQILAAANRVHVRVSELGDDLYRISTPEDAGIRPSPVIRKDDVLLQVTRDGDGMGGEIEVVLAASVRWSLRFAGYAEQQVIDLSGGQVSDIAMVAGVRTAELTLPEPSGTVPVTITGGVDQLTLHSPAGSPMRVRVGGGARTAVAGSRTLRDVPAGSTLTPKDWAAQNRYDVGATSAINTLTVENG